MAIDRSFVQLNRAATERIRRLVKDLSDDQFRQPVEESWTVAICLAHLAFWDRRVMYIMERTQKDGKLFVPTIDIVVNDIALPLWATIPPHEAARLAVETADMCDKKLEAFPDALLEQMYSNRQRDVVRALHRNEHLDRVDQALRLSRAGG